MVTYISRRLIGLVPVWLGVTVLVFSIMHLSPGDPATIILGPKATAESIAQLNAQMGLDKPLLVQYATWLLNVFQGDWGRSIQMRMEVLPLVAGRFSATLLLAVASMALASVIGIGAGMVSAIRKHSLLDRSLMLFVLFGFCLPVFLLGVILQIIFGLKLGWLPISGMHSTGQSSFVDLLKHLVLPTIALSAGAGAVIARMTRSSMLEVLDQDYIRTAVSKGLKEKRIVLIHTLKNAFIPVLTVIGMQLGYLLAGAVLVEMVFSWPGIGTMMVNGILARDFPLVQGIILFVATTYVLVNLLVDVLYAVFDPRISYK